MTEQELLTLFRKKINAPATLSEHQLQVQCVAWFRTQYKDLSASLFAVPNGAYTSKQQAVKLKKEGLWSGVSDLILLIAKGGYHALLIEMKTKKGRQSAAQKAWQSYIETKGYLYCICRSLEDFQQTINNYLS